MVCGGRDSGLVGGPDGSSALELDSRVGWGGGGGSGGSAPPGQEGGDVRVRDALLLGQSHGLAQVDGQEVLALGGANRQTDRQSPDRQTDRQTDGA